MELALIYNFQSLSSFFPFQSSFFSRVSFFVIFYHSQGIDFNLSGIFCRIRRPLPLSHTIFFTQSLEGWITKKSICRYDVLLSVTSNGRCPSTDQNSISKLCNLPSVPRFVIGVYISFVSSIPLSQLKNETSANCLSKASITFSRTALHSLSCPKEQLLHSCCFVFNS